MVNNDIFGTDIQRTWNITDGDLDLVSGEANIGQSCVNRLGTDDDQYTSFYRQYGGRLWEHFGDLNHPTIHEYIRIEIESILIQDPRIDMVECSVGKISADTVECTLKVKSNSSDEVIILNLVLNSNSPVTLEGLHTENENRS